MQRLVHSVTALDHGNGFSCGFQKSGFPKVSKFLQNQQEQKHLKENDMVVNQIGNVDEAYSCIAKARVGTYSGMGAAVSGSKYQASGRIRG